MTIMLLALFAMIVASARVKTDGIHEDYIAKDAIEPIKGIFIIMVFCSHFVQYISLDGNLNGLYLFFRGYLSQLIVVPFLFYSGYGIMEGIKSKGDRYVRSLPVNRFLQVLFKFDMAILLFYLLGLWQGKHYTVAKLLKTLIGWESIGNSNWYILMILACYAFVFLSFRIFPYKEKRMTPIILFSGLLLVFAVGISQYREEYYYNTAFAYPAGMLYSMYKKQIDTNILNTRGKRTGVALGLVLGFLVLHHMQDNIVCYELMSICFALLLVVLTTKVKISSKALHYCGAHLFSLYILQRIPMILLKNTVLARNIYIYFAVSALLTIAFSGAFDHIIGKLWVCVQNSLNMLLEKRRAL